MVPDLLGPIVRDWLSGNHDEATTAWERLLPFIHYENRQCGLRATKALMAEGGIIASPTVRAPLAPLPDATHAGLLALARRHDPLVLRWAE